MTRRYYRAMSVAMLDAFKRPEYHDAAGNFHWSDWVEQEFDPWWYRDHPKPLCVDGHAYHRRRKSR